jgi:hypothetical protein
VQDGVVVAQLETVESQIAKLAFIQLCQSQNVKADASS